MCPKAKCETKTSILNKISHVNVGLRYFLKRHWDSFKLLDYKHFSVIAKGHYFAHYMQIYAHYGTYFPTAVHTLDAFLMRKIFCLIMKHSIVSSHLSLAECLGLSTVYVYFIILFCLCFVLSSLLPSPPASSLPPITLVTGVSPAFNPSLLCQLVFYKSVQHYPSCPVLRLWWIFLGTDHSVFSPTGLDSFAQLDWLLTQTLKIEC